MNGMDTVKALARTRRVQTGAADAVGASTFLHRTIRTPKSSASNFLNRPEDTIRQGFSPRDFSRIGFSRQEAKPLVNMCWVVWTGSEATWSPRLATFSGPSS